MVIVWVINYYIINLELFENKMVIDLKIVFLLFEVEVGLNLEKIFILLEGLFWVVVLIMFIINIDIRLILN